MPNVVYHCKRCGFDIDPDERAVLLAKEIPVHGASIDTVGLREDREMAHECHEDRWTILGYRLVKRGPLRELVP